MKCFKLLLVVFFVFAISFPGFTKDRDSQSGYYEQKPQPKANYTWGEDPQPSKDKSSREKSSKKYKSTSSRSATEKEDSDEKGASFFKEEKEKTGTKKKGFFSWLIEKDKEFQKKYW